MRSKTLKKYIVYIDMKLKEVYSDKNMQRDLKKEMHCVYIDMNKRDLKKLTKALLIRLLLKQQAQKPSNSVKQMVNQYENIIQPPEQFRDAYKPIPPLRTGQWESIKFKPFHERALSRWLKSMKT